MIFQNFVGDQELMLYLPNNPKLETIPREFLLSVLANIKRDKYASMYGKYKEIKMQRSTIGKKVYQAQIQMNLRLVCKVFIQLICKYYYKYIIYYNF
jgi:hypothetical protein